MSDFCGLMQVGVGVADLESAVEWYATVLGFRAKPIDDVAEAALMTRYTGGVAYKRRAVMLFNQNGGGGLEVWQFLDRTPQVNEASIQFDQPGIQTVDLFSNGDWEQLGTHLAAHGVELVKWERSSPLDVVGTFRDPFGNRFRVVNKRHSIHQTFRGALGGVCGTCIACTDLNASKQFYKDILGLTGIDSDSSSQVFSTRTVEAGFSTMYGIGHLELVQCDIPYGVHTYAERFWGDPGLMHVCLEVADLEQCTDHLARMNTALTVDSKSSFQMEKSSGRFAYLEDPDTTLIELIQVYKLPIIPWLNIHYHINSGKPVPRWLIKQMCKPTL